MSRWLVLGGLFFAFAMGAMAQIGTPQGIWLCSGDSLLLTATTEPVSWNTGQTNDSIYVTEPGFYDYELAGISAGGITIEEVPSPTPLTNPEPVTCHGGSDGLVELFSTAGVPLQEVIWDGKQFGTQIVNLSAGIYNYTAIDINGCSTSGSVEITQPDPLALELNVNGGFLEASAMGGTAPYDYFWDDIEGNALIPLPNGSVVLEVIDSQSCSVETTYTSLSENVRGSTSPFISDGILHCDPNRPVFVFTRFGQWIGVFQNNDFVGESLLRPLLVLVYSE